MNSSPISSPRLTLLSPDDKDRLHQAVLHILEKIGMEVLHPRARELMLAAGGRENSAGRITVTAAMLTSALGKAPGSVQIYDREGEPAMDLGGWRSYYGTGSDLWYQLDLQSGERRISVLEDAARAAALAQGLPNLDFVMTAAHASDVEPQRAYLAEVAQLVLNTAKPMIHISMDRPDLEAMWELATIIRGGEEEAVRRPYMIHYAEPVSPLKHGRDSLDKMLFCADKRIPLIYSPAPLAGSTAPLTVAGHIAQGLAEALFGLILHQLGNPGAPFILGVGPAVLDLVTTQSSYNAPEYLLGLITVVEMCRFYGLPSFGYAGTTDSQIPDGQAAFESGLLIYLSGLMGANLNHDVGYLDFGRTGALEFMVMGDEFISQARRFMLGVPVNDETLALEVVEAGAKGQPYLTNPHTLRHCRSEQWRPGLLNRLDYEKWRRAGAKDLRERAREKALAILDSGPQKPLDPGKASRVNRVVDRFRP